MSGDIGRCSCRFETCLDPRSAAWHRAHRVNHLEVFPRCDAHTRANLDRLVEIFEQREGDEREHELASRG